MRIPGAIAVVAVMLHAPFAIAAPPPAHVWAGDAATYTPFARYGLEPRLHLAARVDGLRLGEGFTVDRYGTPFDYDAAINTQLRVGLQLERRWNWLRVLAEYEHDFLSGPVVGGGHIGGTGGQFVPDGDGYAEYGLRKLSALVSFGPYVTLGGGFMTSHWGLGLIANDGAHGWTPGSGAFLDPRGGDRVLRALLATGPHTSQRLTVFAAFDQVRNDDVLFPGDKAIQAIGGIKIGDVDLEPSRGKATDYEAGVYGVWRRQTASDEDVTEVGVVDLYARYRLKLPREMSLDFAFEGAAIFGETDLAPTTEFAKHDVLQLAAALRVSFNGGPAGAVLDVLYASGDRTVDDRSQNAFKVDRNYELGLMLYRQVIAAQTARSPVTAADRTLVGVPAEDLDRLPTRGNITNTIALFPRGWYRPIDGLELSAGVLIALAEVDYADPFNSRLAGGSPRNPTDGTPGTYYGTEFDLGVRYRALLYGSELTLGFEGAVFLPGNALRDANGGTPKAILGGRITADYRF